MSETVESMIAKPLFVQTYEITRADIRRIVDEMANVPVAFKAIDLIAVTPQLGKRPVWFAQEVLNRLFQRWRKLGLVRFGGSHWTMTKGAWAQFQNGVSYTEPSA